MCLLLCGHQLFFIIISHSPSCLGPYKLPSLEGSDYKFTHCDWLVLSKSRDFLRKVARFLPICCAWIDVHELTLTFHRLISLLRSPSFCGSLRNVCSPDFCSAGLAVKRRLSDSLITSNILAPPLPTCLANFLLVAGLAQLFQTKDAN